ncbi:hypothetical protein ARMGADRAFT_49042 [Armillaria gallica]|uniref:Uncharacterized protein n=1 Tax=Armillaria gallica TaxID=47427 RepID=A0A2H3EMA8_ARMGA|nr:hypothetical protein ARMGADRAFT_49042 [Armillaria gallica]
MRVELLLQDLGTDAIGESWVSGEGATRLKVLLDNRARSMGSLCVFRIAPLVHSYPMMLNADIAECARYMSFNMKSLQALACASVDARHYTEGP